MILILPKVTGHTKKDRLLNNTGAIAFTIKVLVNLVFAAFFVPLTRGKEGVSAFVPLTRGIQGVGFIAFVPLTRGSP